MPTFRQAREFLLTHRTDRPASEPPLSLIMRMQSVLTWLTGAVTIGYILLTFDQIGALSGTQFATLRGVVEFYNSRDAWPRCEEARVTEAEALHRGDPWPPR